MNKSEFYKKWYTEEKNLTLNSSGYPPILFKGEDITTEELWTEFLLAEIDLDEFQRLSERACEILGTTYAKPYKESRNYPGIGDQLDALYHDIDDGKLGADAKTGGWFAAVKAVKDEFPKN
jgi:hypothetical protein